MVRVVLIALAIVVVAAAGAALYFSFWREDTISIRVRGLEETVTQGTTLVEAAERFGLRPASGDLLNVQGGVLQRGAFPGRLLLNGGVAPPRPSSRRTTGCGSSTAEAAASRRCTCSSVF